MKHDVFCVLFITSITHFFIFLLDVELEKRKLKPRQVKNETANVKKFVKAGKFLKSWKAFLKSWEKKKELEPAEEVVVADKPLAEECTFPEGFVKHQKVRICSDAVKLICGVQGSLESVCKGKAQIFADAGGRLQVPLADIVPVDGVAAIPEI